MTNIPKIITAGVVHLYHEGRIETLRAGDVVPDWAHITNPDLIGDAPHDDARRDAPQVSSTPDTTPVSSEPTAEELRAEAKALGIATRGSKADLAARIAAAKEAQAGIPATAPADEPASASGDGDRAALEERAKALGIEFDENTTDTELEALTDTQE